MSDLLAFPHGKAGIPAAVRDGVPSFDLITRTRMFALEVCAFCRRLPATREAQETASQLRRADSTVELPGSPENAFACGIHVEAANRV
jgi:hypothetical protein